MHLHDTSGALRDGGAGDAAGGGGGGSPPPNFKQKIAFPSFKISKFSGGEFPQNPYNLACPALACLPLQHKIRSTVPGTSGASVRYNTVKLTKLNSNYM